MRKLLLLFIALTISAHGFAQHEPVNVKKLESDVQRVIQQVYRASVFITNYSSVTGTTGGDRFSGVAIDTAGYILCVAHALITPGNLYQVRFPDGKKYMARALGRIGSNDAAMLKITEKGNWPYAPMGWSSSLKAGMPCIGISYPESVAAKTPTVRLGFIADPLTKDGYLRSTCLMEPGDSGGPLFDMKGRVIGLHSRVFVSLNDNFEVPVDVYRKYWNALIDAQNYVSLPDENAIEIDRQAGQLTVFAGIEKLNTLFDKELTEKISGTSFRIKSPYKSGRMQANVLGTLINMKGIFNKEALKNKSYLLSKSSMVADAATVELKPDYFVPAKVISRDIETDLVLLQVDQLLKGGVNLNAATSDTVSFTSLGRFLLSPKPDGSLVVSVIGNTPIDIPKVPGNAYTGIVATEKDGKVFIGSLLQNTPARNASLLEGDELLSINGKRILIPEDLNNEVDSYTTRDTVSLMLLREGKAFEKRVEVRIRETSVMHVASKFEDGRSIRYSGFSKVMIHDGRLKPVECGGALYGVDGKFYGINIARFSRTSSLAIPVEAIKNFVNKSKSILNN